MFSCIKVGTILKVAINIFLSEFAIIYLWRFSSNMRLLLCLSTPWSFLSMLMLTISAVMLLHNIIFCKIPVFRILGCEINWINIFSNFSLRATWDCTIFSRFLPRTFLEKTLKNLSTPPYNKTATYFVAAMLMLCKKLKFDLVRTAWKSFVSRFAVGFHDDG